MSHNSYTAPVHIYHARTPSARNTMQNIRLPVVSIAVKLVIDRTEKLMKASYKPTASKYI